MPVVELVPHEVGTSEAYFVRVDGLDWALCVRKGPDTWLCTPVVNNPPMQAVVLVTAKTNDDLRVVIAQRVQSRS